MEQQHAPLLAVEWVKIEELFGSPSNPRRNDLAVEPVAASLRRFGWQQPVVAKPSGEVIAGNTRLKAAKLIGLDLVPVVRFTGTDLDATAYAIADNRTSEFAEWDEDALRELVAVLQAQSALEAVGGPGPAAAPAESIGRGCASGALLGRSRRQSTEVGRGHEVMRRRNDLAGSRTSTAFVKIDHAVYARALTT